MPKTILNEAETQEARAALMGLSGPCAKSEAQRLADHFGCHVSRVYAATKSSRPKRKARTDRGKRRVDLKNDAGMSLATSLVVGHNLDPDLALETARANGFATPISLGTYRRQLREAGLNRSQRRSRRVVHRRFEAERPGQIYQFDISGVKERWVDVRNKRILQVHAGDVNANHPNRKSTRVPLWKFTMQDDHSRFLYTRFVACLKPNSCHVIDFELEAFRAMGVPQVLYTDNDSVIVSKLNQRAASILDHAFAASEGFKLSQHMPYNSNATGKVEKSHQMVEKFEKLISIGEVPTVDDLNVFAARFCDYYNNTDHRTTGIKPELRFRAGHAVMRVPPDALLNDAFKAREFEVKVNSDVTISVDAKSWQLPRSAKIASTLHGAKEVDNPFIDLAQIENGACKVVWPIEAEWFIAIAGGIDFEFLKVEAVADLADEHKSVAESTSERNTKHFKEVAASNKKAVREAAKRGEQSPIVVPGIDVKFEIAAQPRPAMMPRQKVDPSLVEWANLAPGAIAPSMVDGRLLTYFQAAETLQEQDELSNPLNLSDQAWLKSVMAGREKVSETELREQLEKRNSRPQLSEVKSA